MATLTLARLIDRKLIRIAGPDCYSYLQGLLCNDVRHLYEQDRIPQRKHARNTINSMSTFMLNPHGKAICDMILYRTPATLNECKFHPPGEASEQDELLVECDAKFSSGLANTLYAYRVRRKVSLNIEQNLSVWSLFPKLGNSKELIGPHESCETSLVNSISSNEVVQSDLTVVCDPRLSAMGMRILSPDQDFDQLKSKIESLVNIGHIQKGSSMDYKRHRLMLGVGEGVKDHPESSCIPLECNADFLGSVSFNKGCYMGQELTARIHHTGVVRKRLMPVIVDLETGTRDKAGLLPLIDNSDIIDEPTKRKVGVLRRVIDSRGLALIRYELALKSEKLVHESTKTKITPYVPFWWELKQ